MGAFYVSICVTDLSDDLVAQLNSANDRFLLGPEVDSWTCIVSRNLDTQDFQLLDSLGKFFTKDSDRKAFAVLNHDDSILSVDIYIRGEMIGGYNSCPGYFSENPTEEQMRPRLRNAEGYAALKAGVTVDEVRSILVPEEPIVFASETHSGLVDLLGLPEYSKYMGYSYVEAGESNVKWRDPNPA